MSLEFPGGLVGKESACSAGNLDLIMGWEDPLKDGTATHSSILSWRMNPHGQRSLAGYNLWGCRELDMTERLSTA